MVARYAICPRNGVWFIASNSEPAMKGWRIVAMTIPRTRAFTNVSIRILRLATAWKPTSMRSV